MAELKGSNTEKNLQEAFAGESQAFQKYTFYAAAARKAGMNQIADYFEETAHNESAHAKLWFQALHGGDISADIEANLRDAAAGENYEYTTMYKNFADEAEREGFAKIAYQMREVARIESQHEARYLALAARVAGKTVFRSDDGPIAWICANCGYIHVGEEAPKLCPVCAHPQAYFQRHVEAY
ncbi:rubrerythrin [Veillonella agrestimuris]|uniref:rubrerythrin n=1 Tax=Veillonella agrestimuris TaxID=2941340 RepID=UPI00203BED9C|nr:rubrerythrin family protein [Veillonella agrestimuris]